MSAAFSPSPPPYISQPPIYDAFQDENGAMTPSWVNWINSITQVTGFCIIQNNIVNASAPGTIKPAVVLLAPSYSKAERDAFSDNFLGSVIYNATSGFMNFYTAAGWVTFTEVPAP